MHGMTSESAAPVEVFLDEYSRDETIAKYLSETAGAGIAYALTHVYAPVYLGVVKALIAQRARQHTFRILEYGCGGGMNLLKVIELFRQQRTDATGCGTDFSPRMIEAARQEAARHLPAELHKAVRFVVAANETLGQDLVEGLGGRNGEIEGSFDVVVGVNTFRYCHRLNKETDCAREIFRLLSPGGYSIMIDMNRRFPLFRSKVADILRRRPPQENYLPSLEQYTRPFAGAGFRIVETRNFCWVPHSAASSLVALCRMVAPLLDLCCSPFAMRSLVIAQRPA
jgi:SAM-dependent methyltransferase